MVLGDGIRRNIATVSKEERDRLRNAIIKLQTQNHYLGGRNDMPTTGGVSYWFKQDEIHANTHVHNCPAFVPWHRELINRFEALIRQVDPELSLHYWDWTQDPRRLPDGKGGFINLFTADFFGNPNVDTGEPWQANAAPWRPDGIYVPDADPYRSDIENDPAHDNPFDPPRHVQYGVGASGGLVANDSAALNAASYVAFHHAINVSHGTSHNYIGGTLLDPHTSFRAPAAFFLHANLDRIFAKWQLDPAHPQRLDPAHVYDYAPGDWGIDPVTHAPRDPEKGNGDLAVSDFPWWGFSSPMEPWAGPGAQTPATGIVHNVSPVRPWAPPENEQVYKDCRHPSVVKPPSYDIIVVDSYTVGPLRLRIFAATSDCAQHPGVAVAIPDGWLILGGGAFVDWDDGVCAGPGSLGNILTGMYPESGGTVWVATSKDHLQPSPAQITGYCIAAQMQNGTPIPPGDYQIFRQDSGVAAHPSAQVVLPGGWVLVGGGARANYAGLGNMLYASIPSGNSWIASAKDHLQSDPATVTAFAIGLRQSFLAGAGLAVTSQSITTPIPTNHPWTTLVIPDFHLVGGGAQVNWTGLGNLLTASFPQDRQTWIARGKDHLQPDPATITAWSIGLVPA